MRVRWNTYGINLLRETDIKRKIELTQIKRQIEMLSTFMPDEILNMPLTELDEIHNFVGVLLFADVSGFTPLCEKYYKTGKGGIYRLTATLNAYIGALVEVITFYGGDILKFSGDAFLALWKAPPDLRLFEVIHQVIVCALFIQNTLGCFETEVNVLLKVKLAIACGNLTFSVIGNESYRHYIITGQAINDVKCAERESVSGDVVVAPSAWGHLAEDNYEVTYAPDGNVKIWNCVYFPNQASLKQHYANKSPIAHALCVKHLEHRSQLHEKRRIDDATTDSKITESFIASLPQRPSVKAAPMNWIPNDLNPFIVRPVQSQVEEKQPIEYLTEMRQVTIQFINIVPTTFQDSKLVPMVNTAYQIVCKIVSKVRGVVNKVSLFDKDCMILVLFGLRGIEHEVESQNALKSAFAIRKAIKKLSSVKSISIGVTNGFVYCGVVGHPFRREYTVIGGAVNKAARIMCAYEGKVTCDHETYKSCKLSSLYFQVQSALKLKGIADAGYIFEYNEDFDKMAYEDKQSMPLIGRNMEIGVADVILQHPELAGWTSICFKGESKVGKTKILQEINKRYSTSNRYTCSMVLNEGLQRPFYTASTIYHQLYDIMTKHNPTVLEQLPRYLWDLNEILQVSRSVTSIEMLSSPSKDLINEHFNRMCKGIRPILVFIDNIQFIDKRSLDLIEQVLQKKLISLVCAGCFEDNSTWNTMWKLSRCNRIKVFNIEPLPSTEIALLMCSFLNVKGVSKKLIVLINKTCEGRPGYVQACLLKMINNGELEVKYALTSETEYAFLEDVDKKHLVLVAGFSKKYLEHGEETSTAVTLDLFDSFSPYQQLIIKTAAVLGDIFTRTTLIVLLKYPNESMLAAAIKTLFEEEIFDCASRYVNSGGLQEKKNVCVCYMEEEEYDLELELPRYAFCKVLHFKSRNIKTLAYELLPLNQKKELHLRITDLLENQNNSCPKCLRDNSASIISVRRFKDLIKYCHDQKYIWLEKYNENYVSVEDYKAIIREYVHNPPVYAPNSKKRQWTSADVPKRRVWDPTTCFCLEILTKVYRDLIHHSHCAQHLGKKIFFMLEYGVILSIMSEYEEALTILHEASELCMVQTNKAYVFTGNFKQVMMGKIHYLMGHIYLKLGNTTAAKNHALLSLRQYNVPLISFKYTLPYILLNKAWFLRFGRVFNSITKQDNPLIKLDFGLCMGLIGSIYAAEGCWQFAKQAAARSVLCLRRTNSNIDVLCDVYTSAVYLYSFCGDMHICEKLERCFNKEVLKYYSNNITHELRAIATVIGVLFLVKVLSGSIIESLQLGYRTVHLQLSLEAHYSLVEVVPTLATVLICLERVAEAVYMARILLNFGQKYHTHSSIGYYAFCVELLLETNFCLEPIEKIEQIAQHLIDQKKYHSDFGNKLIINIYCYYLRYKPGLAPAWKKLYNLSDFDNFKIMSILNTMRYTECLLLEMVRSLQRKRPIPQEEIDEANVFLNRMKKAAKKWPFFKPRFWHLKAYNARILNKMQASINYLKNANTFAAEDGNILEECWTMLHATSWFGGYSSDKEAKHLKWELAKTYTPLQWCQILYALPTE
ncbi:adenylate cyclase type 10-like [Tribolium madens]|uniref:adenylate cyclase type 10-like n=1 Tax=Tribolium madens TaxID=41895 RepID=UPI001CF73867|nr:adenylate cyclase type 10-like [Tribolium madens]